MSVQTELAAVSVVNTGAGPTRSLNGARIAFIAGDVEASRDAHNKKASASEATEGLLDRAPEKHGGAGSEYVKSIIFGGLDGIITTFAIVSASVGAGFSVDVILLMGFANLIADGISMGFGDYLSSQAELDYAKNEYKREEWEVENNVDGEKQEMVQIYMEKGMSKEDAETVIEIFSKHKTMFVDLMMVEELGLEVPDADAQPWKEGCVTFFSFLTFGSVPLWMYIIFKVADTQKTLQSNTMFGLTCAATVGTMFSLGVFKAKVTKQNMCRSGFFMALNGTIAASAAFLVGWIFEVALGIDTSGCGS